MSTDELIAEALRLPPEERARFAEELLASLEEPEDEVARAWAPELARRVRELEDGSVEGIPAETVFSELTKKLEEQRARRVPS
jgi:putative addiction module component (TIGR02574 family)